MVSRPHQKWALVLTLILTSSLSCGGDEDDSTSSSSDAATSNAATSNASTSNTATSNTDFEDCDVIVSPSDNDQDAIQLAFIDAEEGQTLCLDEGTYSLNQQLSLSANNITLKGAGATSTILDFSAQDIGANGISITGDNVVVEDLQVKETPGDGIRATDTDGITFRRVHVIWEAESSVENGAYGLYPVGCTNVLVEESFVVGARDAGIYVGQSNQVIVRNNEARGNVAGIEVENTLDADIYGNHAHDNTGGILVFDLPGLDQFGARAKVHDNLIENNNRENFAEEGAIVAVVPAGTGILILSSDDNEFHDNTIQGNKSAGVILVSFSEALTGRAPDDPNFDIFPQGNYIHDNTFLNNGGDPAPIVGAATAGFSPSPDIIWDGCTDENAMEESDRNCVQNNGDATYLNFNLLCGDAVISDLDEVDCSHEPLNRIELP